MDGQSKPPPPPNRFQPGNKVGHRGRPPRAREAAKLLVLKAVVEEGDKWRRICEVAVDDAINGEDGSTRDKGRRFVTEYLVGRPQQTITITPSSDEPDEWGELSDTELEAIASAGLANFASAADSESGGGDAGAGTPEAD